MAELRSTRTEALGSWPDEFVLTNGSGYPRWLGNGASEAPPPSRRGISGGVANWR